VPYRVALINAAVLLQDLTPFDPHLQDVRAIVKAMSKHIRRFLGYSESEACILTLRISDGTGCCENIFSKKDNGFLDEGFGNERKSVREPGRSLTSAVPAL